MALRKSLKVPKYGLFYFESDKTTSIVPLNKIKKVVSGDNTSVGSVVQLDYAGVLFKGKIVAVNDDKKVLHQEEVEFLRDPRNAHLFEQHEEEEEEEEPAEEIQAQKKQKKVTKRKSKTNKQQAPKKAKPTKTKEKELAVVVQVFSPGHDSSASVLSRTQGSSWSPRDASTPRVNLQHHSLSLYSDPPSRSNATISSQSLSPRRLNFNDTRHTTRTSLSVSPPYRPSVSSLSLPSSESIYDDTLRAIMQRIEAKLDQVLQDRAAAPTHQPATPATPADVLPPAENRNVAEDEQSPAILREVASSTPNFAVRLLRKMCSQDELIGRNIQGLRGKQPVSEDKVNQIRGLVFQYYPVPPSQREGVWRECRKGMDAYLRRLTTRAQ